MSPVVIGIVIAATTLVLAIMDRIFNRGKREASVTESISAQQELIDDLSAMIHKHEIIVHDIQVQCARRIAETSTTEQMRCIIQQELKQMPNMIISMLIERKLLKTS